MDAAIQLSEITERYDSGARPALGGVGLSAAHAEAAAVAWPSGSGKPSLPRLSAALQRRASGAVTVLTGSGPPPSARTPRPSVPREVSCPG